MHWTRVHGELMITDRQRSGYAYRIRDTDRGVSILIAEGPISGPRLPTRREECSDFNAAVRLADQWESDHSNLT